MVIDLGFRLCEVTRFKDRVPSQGFQYIVSTELEEAEGEALKFVRRDAQIRVAPRLRGISRDPWEEGSFAPANIEVWQQKVGRGKAPIYVTMTDQDEQVAEVHRKLQEALLKKQEVEDDE